MINFFKLFKIYFKQNLKVFISYSIISFIALIVFFIINKFNVDSAIKYSVSSSVELAINIGHRIDIFTLVQTIIFIAFLITTVHTVFSDYFGSLYAVMQLPLNRAFHILSIILEATVFLAVQYLFLYILVKADYAYIINTLSRIENVSLFKVLDGFRQNNSVFAFGYQYPIWNLSPKNIIYRLLICWPVISLYLIMAYMGIYRFGVKIVALVITAFIIIISLTGIFGYVSEIMDAVMKYIIEVVFQQASFRNILNSIVLLIVLGISNSFIIREKIDF